MSNDIDPDGGSPLIGRVGKPTFWCKKNKRQDQHAKDIPLPRRALVIPKRYFPGDVRNEAHFCNFSALNGQLNDVSIPHLDDALASGCCFGIMRNHYDCLIE